ncbi:hypothetical protein ACFYTV_30100, partial [Streptomyces sp. NPDC004562]
DVSEECRRLRTALTHGHRAYRSPTLISLEAVNAGVDPTEVAERAGNSVEVLLTRYAKCLDGRQDVANRRIEELLREYE